MTKVSPELELGDDQMQMEAIVSVSADVSFTSNRFPKYKIGADNQILDEAKEDPKGPSLKEVVTQETAHLVEQQKRLSVRDLATKFDKNLSSAAKLSNEAKLREVASLEGHVLLKKVRDALESLRVRLAGRNKEDVEKAISMVEALAVKLTQEEGELIQEKFEVKKLANFLKQASEDAKKLVNQERSFACAEIESARAVVQRFGEALEEEERISQTSGKQELEELLEEVQEARRIKLLHQPSKVIDMEHELQALRIQIREKSIISVKLQRELTMNKRAEENKFRLYELDGSESLGSSLRVQPCSGEAQELSKCSIQWYRMPTEGNRREIIAGANKSIYAPEPFDVGRFLEVDIFSTGQKVLVTTGVPIGPAAGVACYVETLLRKPNTEFNVVISLMNGQNYSSRSVHLFHVGKMRMKLCRGWITKARESYSKSMQLCGFRGGGNSAAKSLFWQVRKGQSFVLVFESERERNAAIMLARRYALDCNVMLAGPDDQAFM
ncbi:stomatal closure-related actin-binding protein 1-like [Actinidia eriantha]|uniref:stomatal closure-related actin-binding protein 1-like n=1 Tax=Actinidia eriantha TaxID=165200 RepID=UPI0025848A9D|nr:stomatal closure-related actin-binding protein 1-like [Actinidia eriantha]XP_057467107.1 stomatal closure-related actin-binding protein 1-like [Actinidia eriantha]